MKHSAEIKLNIASSILLQAVSGICGLILPRLLLSSYGSEANGLSASISQLLSYTVLLEGGIGGVMRAALYKPLANRDMEGVSSIYHQIKGSFQRISYIYLAFSFLLAIGIKFLLITQFDWLYVSTLVLILCSHTYFNYYFILPQWTLIAADQKLFIIQFTQIVTTIINLLVCSMIIHLGGGMHAVKFASAIVILLNPMVLRTYVKRHYRIHAASDIKKAQIPQKRDGIIHHLAYFIHYNTDIVIISLFSSLANVSVYTVYRAVINILERLLISVSSGLSSAYGNLIAREEWDELDRLISRFEAWNNALATATATVCAILIVPFVAVYTKGIYDANYTQPIFAILMIAGSYVYCVRHPFESVISAAGHYKQTKAGAVGEVVINLGLSLLLVKPMGLTGVALGTFSAMSFRTIYILWYLSKHILHRRMRTFLLKLLTNVSAAVLLIYVVPAFIGTAASDIWSLFICAVTVSIVVFPISIAINILLNIRYFLRLR